MFKYIALLIILLLITYAILSGKTSTDVEPNLTVPETIKEQNQSHKFTDEKNISWLKFRVDSYNQIIFIDGIVGNPQQKESILNYFNQVYPQLTQQQQIVINENINAKGIPENLRFLLATTESIQQLEVTLTRNKLTLTGLVRNKKTKESIIQQLKSIFLDELTLSIKLKQVVDTKIKINNLKFKPKLIPFPPIRNDS